MILMSYDNDVFKTQYNGNVKFDRLYSLAMFHDFL